MTSSRRFSDAVRAKSDFHRCNRARFARAALSCVARLPRVSTFAPSANVRRMIAQDAAPGSSTPRERSPSRLARPILATRSTVLSRPFCRRGGERVERRGKALAARRRRGERLQGRRIGVDQRLVADLGLADRLDFLQAAGATSARTLRRRSHSTPSSALGETRKHHAVERPHRAADLGHQHVAQGRQRGVERAAAPATQPLRREREALGHVDAVIAVADQAVDVAQIDPVLDDAAGDRQDDVAAPGVGKALHRGASHSGAGQATSTASNSFSSSSSAMIVSVAPTISSEVKKLPT